MRILCITLLALAAGTSLYADGWIELSDRSRRLVHPHPRPGQIQRPRPAMEVTRHWVDLEVARGVATVSVDETFRNPHSHQLEGTYYFPVPKGGHVSDFRVTLGDKELIGEVLEREKAREIYRNLVRRAIDPAILEYYGRDLFRARVFPIPAKGDVRLRISYRQVLKRENGIQSIRYPLDTGRFAVGPYRDVRIKASLETDRMLKSVHSPSHDVVVVRQGSHRAEVSFEAATLAATKDFVLELLTADDTLAGGIQTYRVPGEDGYFLLRLSPGHELPDRRAPVDLVFVVDTSGSMAGDKIRHARRALNDALRRLRPEDHFTILTFSNGVRAFSAEALPATPENVVAAQEFVKGLRARGGTNLSGAVDHGLRVAHARPSGATLVLLSDGAPTVGETNASKIVRAAIDTNRGDHRLHVFGVGIDVKTVLLDELARKNGGSRTYLTESRKLESSISGLLDKVLFPCLAGLRITASGLSLEQLEPEGPYDLFFGEDLVVTGRYRGSGQVPVEVRGTLQGESRVFVFPAEFRARGGDEVAAFLWGENRIDSLLESMRSAPVGARAALRQQIVDLGLRFGIVTPFTASLVQEDDGAIAGALRRRVQASPRARGAADEAASGFYERDRRDAFDYSRKLGAKKQAMRRSGKTFALEAESKAEAASLASQLKIRHAGGRGFIPVEGKTYVDGTLGRSRADELPEPTKTFDYASEEYFAFMAKHPETAPIFAAGRSLIFKHGEDVIQVKDVELPEPPIDPPAAEPQPTPKPDKPTKRWF